MANNAQPIQVAVVVGEDVAERIRKFGTSILNLHPSMEKSGAYLSKFFQGEVFVSRGAIIGKPWKPLDDRYAASKARTFPGRPPMIRSGALNRGFRYRADKLSVDLYNEVFYHRFHQNGEGVPQRVTMDVAGPRLQKVVSFVSDDINGKMAAANV